MIEKVYEILEAVRDEQAADPRTAVYDVDVRWEGSSLSIVGATSEPAAAEALHARLAAIGMNYTIRDLVVRRPEPGDGKLAHGLVTTPVAPMVAGPIISDPQISQVLLGNHVLVLREHGRWLQCRSTDGYIGWIHRGGVLRQDEVDARAWEIGAVGPLHLSLGGVVNSLDGGVLARLPWGARMVIRGNLALLPDGSEGRFKGRAVAMAQLGQVFRRNGRAIVASARQWLGAPYLWAGVTPWGVDCSGLVQGVFRTHGLELPRDSDQQAMLGEPVDVRRGFGRVRAGDLLFFAEEASRISHVAISMGGSRIIHAAVGNGVVRRNDLAGDSGFERELRRLLVGVRRVLSGAA